MIKGLSDKRRFSRLGKIRLGEKKKGNSNGREYEYPSKIDYFKIDPYDPSMKAKLEELYGAKPRKLKIVLPDEDIERIFPQYYEQWSASALLCKGTGETAMRNDGTGNLVPCECPGPDTCPFALEHGTVSKGIRKTGCKRVARLQAILSEFDSFGVFQLDTGSANSIININSALDFLKTVTGRISFMELDLIVKAQTCTIPDTGKQGTIYVCDILLPVGIRDVSKLKPLIGYVQDRNVDRLLPPPDDRPEDLLPALPAPQHTTAAIVDGVDQETGEVLNGDDFDEDGAPFDTDDNSDAIPTQATEPARWDIDPEVVAAFDAAGASKAKRNAMLLSAETQNWNKSQLIDVIKKSGNGKTTAVTGAQKPLF